MASYGESVGAGAACSTPARAARASRATPRSRAPRRVLRRAADTGIGDGSSSQRARRTDLVIVRRRASSLAFDRHLGTCAALGATPSGSTASSTQSVGAATVDLRRRIAEVARRSRPEVPRVRRAARPSPGPSDSARTRRRSTPVAARSRRSRPAAPPPELGRRLAEHRQRGLDLRERVVGSLVGDISARSDRLPARAPRPPRCPVRART